MSPVIAGLTSPTHSDASEVCPNHITPQKLASVMQSGGQIILRYGLVAILFYVGAFKFTQVEAEAIQPLISNSPFLAWLYDVLSVQNVSNLIGIVEIIAGALIAVRPFQARASAIGSLIAVGVFLTTLSFLVTTPGSWTNAPGFALSVPTEMGWFLLKDVFLLGGALWTAGEALATKR